MKINLFLVLFLLVENVILLYLDRRLYLFYVSSKVWEIENSRVVFYLLFDIKNNIFFGYIFKIKFDGY